MKKFEIGTQVVVTMSRIAQSDIVWQSKVVDVAETGVWVEEEYGTDWVFVNLTNPNINNVEELERKVEVYKNQEMKSIKADLMKAIKWEDEDITVSVKVYDCTDGEQSYDVEVQYAIGDVSYTDCFVSDCYQSNIYGDEELEKQAVKRAKAVLKTVKGWFEGSEQVTVTNSVEVYHA